MIELAIDTKKLKEIEDLFKDVPKKYLQARNSAMKDVKERSQNFIIRTILKTYNVNKEKLTNKLNDTTKYDGKSLSIRYSGRPLNIMSFDDATPRTPPSSMFLFNTTRKQKILTPAGFISVYPRYPYEISVSILKGKNKTLSAVQAKNGKSYHPFVMRTGAKDPQKTPFFIAKNNGIKKDSGKTSVSGLTTLSIPQMISNNDVSEKIKAKQLELYMKRFAQTAVRNKLITVEQKDDFIQSLGYKIRRNKSK